MKKLCVLSVIATLMFCGAVTSAEQASTTNGGVYLIAYRTPGHVRASSPDVFHSAVADVRKMLQEKGVVLAVDPERGSIENESQMSVESMTALAKDVKAESLLFLTVDRPTSKWIKLTFKSYDLTGKLLWEENVDSGMSPMTGGAGYKKCFEKLAKILPQRVGGPGLPIAKPGDTKADAARSEKKS